jgi:tetratricopeptide (TPR) repeat protein
MAERRFWRTAFLAGAVGLGSAWGAAPAGEPTDFPPDARQRYEQGQDLRKKGQFDEAVRAFEEAIRLGMDAFPRAHLQEAATNLDLKKYDAAIAKYTKFLDRFGVEDSCRL